MIQPIIGWRFPKKMFWPCRFLTAISQLTSLSCVIFLPPANAKYTFITSKWSLWIPSWTTRTSNQKHQLQNCSMVSPCGDPWLERHGSSEERRGAGQQHRRRRGCWFAGAWGTFGLQDGSLVIWVVGLLLLIHDVWELIDMIDDNSTTIIDKKISDDWLMILDDV